MSKIEWTDETWNPTTGCAKVSAGCKNCYAEVMSKRLAAMNQEKYQGIMTEGGRFNGRVRTHMDELRKPFSWKKPRKVFVNSMSDLFHEDVPFEFIDKVLAVMALTPQHTYQILTKRPKRMAEYMATNITRRQVSTIVAFSVEYHDFADPRDTKEHLPWPLPNVWLGTSVENQEAANERIPHLLKCPAAVRFLSCEPLVGAVDLSNFITPATLSTINWLIAGGESGPHATPMHTDWARTLRDQCASAGIPFFFKQWGEYKFYDGFPIPLSEISKVKFYTEDGELIPVSKKTPANVLNKFPLAVKLGKKAAGNLLDGRKHEAFPKTAPSITDTYNADHLTPCKTNYQPLTP